MKTLCSAGFGGETGSSFFSMWCLETRILLVVAVMGNVEVMDKVPWSKPFNFEVLYPSEIMWIWRSLSYIMAFISLSYEFDEVFPCLDVWMGY